MDRIIFALRYTIARRWGRRKETHPWPEPELVDALKSKTRRLKDLPLLQQPIAKTRFVIFDTETTGLNPSADEVTSLSAVVIQGETLKEPSETFDQLVNPYRPIPALATEITGIDDSMVETMPNIYEVLSDFLDFAGDAVLVAHHADFDVGLINRKLFYCQTKLYHPVVDTALLSRTLFPTRSSHSLDFLLSTYGITDLGRHTSLGDSLMTARLFLFLMQELSKRQPTHTVGELMNFLHLRASYL